LHPLPIHSARHGLYYPSRYFFFQAEDGIRDATVTGVQTCALPISWSRRANKDTAPERKELSTELPLWFSNLAFWSLQVAVLVLAAGILARALRIQQPRVLLASCPSLLAVSLLLPLLQPWHDPQAAPALAISAEFALLPNLLFRGIRCDSPCRAHSCVRSRRVSPFLSGGFTCHFRLLGPAYTPSGAFPVLGAPLPIRDCLP